jgi:hypothetical protein
MPFIAFDHLDDNLIVDYYIFAWFAPKYQHLASSLKMNLVDIALLILS